MQGTEQVTETDLHHLRRCIELATEALEAGDAPFGSVLAGADGRALTEDRNRTSGAMPLATPSSSSRAGPRPT